LLIGDASFCEPGGAVGPAEVAAFHGDAVEPVHQAAELGAVELQDGLELDAGGLEAGLVLGVAGAAFGGGVGELLELHAGGDLAGADLLFDLAFGGGAARGLGAGGELLQAVVALDGAHEGFLALVVLGIADDFTSMGDSVGQDVDVLVLGVGVAGDEVLVVTEFHADQILAADVGPLGVAEFLARGGGEGNVQDGFAQIGAEFADGAEFG
jgi:hypothetical protein